MNAMMTVLFLDAQHAELQRVAAERAAQVRPTSERQTRPHRRRF